MTTSKTNANTITKIEPNAIPPSCPCSALFCFPSQDAAYNPAELKMNPPKLSLIKIDPLLHEDHCACLNYSDPKDFRPRKN